MKLSKLTITPLDSKTRAPQEEITVPFNPNSYTITKAVKWDTAKAENGDKKDAGTDRRFNAPALVFGGGESRQLSLELLFDVTEPIDGVVMEDVRTLTNQIVNLTRIVKDAAKPPVCRVEWGAEPPEGSDLPFEGVIVNLSQRFTLFSRNGRPVRANLSLTLREDLPREAAKKEVDPEATTRIVRQGDSLSSLAAEVYGDAARWRVIATANNIDDARVLVEGTRLSIPKTR